MGHKASDGGFFVLLETRSCLCTGEAGVPRHIGVSTRRCCTICSAEVCIAPLIRSQGTV